MDYTPIWIAVVGSLLYYLLNSNSEGNRTQNRIHPSHGHHSLEIDNKSKDTYTCEVCKMYGYGRRYRCTSIGCVFDLHLECMDAKKERRFQEQKFNLQTTPDKSKSCDACEKKVEGYWYHCPMTNQAFHPLCVPKLEHYPGHHCPRHGLVKDEKYKGTYQCNGCLMEGSGRRYRCIFQSCNFTLHFECMHATKVRTFQKQEFKSLPKPECTKGNSCTGKCMSCGACEEKVLGCVYHCSKTDQVFHPLCFPKYRPYHPHGLVKEEKCKDVYECDGCRMEGTGRRYRCSENNCDYKLHFECMDAAKECTFQGHECTFHEKPISDNNRTTSCNACGEKVEGFVYHCSKTDQNFHPICTKLESKMISAEGVAFSLKEYVASTCALCNRKRPRGGVLRGWSYVSERDECIHVCCVIALKKELSKEISQGDSSLPLAERMKLPVKSKSGRTNWWMKIFKLVKALISILLTGDPITTGYFIMDLLHS